MIPLKAAKKTIADLEKDENIQKKPNQQTDN